MPSDEARKEKIRRVLKSLDDIDGRVEKIAQLIDDAMQPKWTRVEDGLPVPKEGDLVSTLSDSGILNTQKYYAQFGWEEKWVIFWLLLTPLPPPPKEDR